MRSVLLLLMAAVMLVSGVWFFHATAELLVGGDYVAGLIHVLVGWLSVQAGVRVARLAVVLRLRS